MHRDGQGDQAGIRRRAVAQGEVDGLSENVRNPVGKLDPQADARVFEEKIVQPAEDHIAAEIRGQRELQWAADRLVGGADFVAGRGNAGQSFAAVMQKELAGRSQAQAAGRADEDGGAQFALDALDRRTGRRRRQVELARRRRQAAGFGCTQEKFEFTQLFHGRSVAGTISISINF